MPADIRACQVRRRRRCRLGAVGRLCLLVAANHALHLPLRFPDLPTLRLPRPPPAQPTVFCAVPRVFERFESTTADKAGGGGGALQVDTDVGCHRCSQPAARLNASAQGLRTTTCARLLATSPRCTADQEGELAGAGPVPRRLLSQACGAQSRLALGQGARTPPSRWGFGGPCCLAGFGSAGPLPSTPTLPPWMPTRLLCSWCLRWPTGWCSSPSARPCWALASASSAQAGIEGGGLDTGRGLTLPGMHAVEARRRRIWIAVLNSSTAFPPHPHLVSRRRPAGGPHRGLYAGGGLLCLCAGERVGGPGRLEACLLAVGRPGSICRLRAAPLVGLASALRHSHEPSHVCRATA